MWQKIKQDRHIVGLFTLLVIIAAVPLTLYLGQKQQDVRQRAADQICTTDQPTDTMIIMDQSGSMRNPPDEPRPNRDKTARIESAKTAADAFVDILSQHTQSPLHQASLTLFSDVDKSTVIQPMTTNLNSIKSAIDAIAPIGETCIDCGIKKAVDDLKSHDRTNIKNVAILLTDGEATQSISDPNASKETAIQNALTAALEAHNDQNITFYTIGFSKFVEEGLLRNIAEQTGGKYYFAPDGAALTEIYKHIAEEIGKSEIRGTVYNDSNRNQTKDAQEIGLSGWTVTLTDTTSNSMVATTTTSADGSYSFTGVCDGAYKISLTLKTNWDVTTSSGSDLSLTISQGNVPSNNDFGVAQHPSGTSLTCVPNSIILNSTPQALSVTLKDSLGNPLAGKTISWSGSTLSHLSTASSITNINGVASTLISIPASTSENVNDSIQALYAGDTGSSTSACQISTAYTPSDTTLSLNVYLHGIGNAGDNANLTSSSLSNKNPLHTSRSATVYINDTKNTQVKQADSTIVYDPASGSYKGSFTLGSSFPSGKYTVKVAVDHYLHRLIPGLITLSPDKNNIIPTVSLISGDTNSDNRLDILDYNTIIDCYSDYQAPISCYDSKKEATDLTDDGNVNQFDNNLFIRELSVQFGD